MEKLTIDELYNLFSKASKAQVNGDFYDVLCAYDEGVEFRNEDGDEFDYTYEKLFDMINNNEIELYELKKINIGEMKND